MLVKRPMDGLRDTQGAITDRGLDQGTMEELRKLLEEVWEGLGGEAGGEGGLEEVWAEGQEVGEHGVGLAVHGDWTAPFRGEHSSRKAACPALCVCVRECVGYLDTHVSEVSLLPPRVQMGEVGKENPQHRSTAQ